MPELEAVH